MPTRICGEIRRDSQPDDRRHAGRDERVLGHHERRLKLNYDDQPAGEKSNECREGEYPPLNEASVPASEEDGHGPYNRGDQFEATELDGDSPATQITRGAHKRDQEDWQDEARNPASRTSEKK